MKDSWYMNFKSMAQAAAWNFPPFHLEESKRAKLKINSFLYDQALITKLQQKENISLWDTKYFIPCFITQMDYSVYLDSKRLGR